MNGTNSTTRRRLPASVDYDDRTYSAASNDHVFVHEANQFARVTDQDKVRRKRATFKNMGRIRSTIRHVCILLIIMPAVMKLVLNRFDSDNRNMSNASKIFSSKQSTNIKSKAYFDDRDAHRIRVVQRLAKKTDARKYPAGSRGRTNWALQNSDCRPQYERVDDVTMINRLPSIGFTNLHPRNETQLYIDDGGEWGWRAYYAFDDDHIRSSAVGKEENQHCMRPLWYNTYYPTCNEIHASISGEQWLLQDDSLNRKWKAKGHDKIPFSKYLGSGFYRNAFLLHKQFVQTEQHDLSMHSNVRSSVEFDEVVFKSMKQLDKKKHANTADVDVWEYDSSDRYSYIELMEDMRKDGMVMELLTFSSRSVNIYSFCGLSSVIEFAPIDIEEFILRRKDHHPNLVQGLPANDHINPREKLDMALEIAKCLAEMHGFVDGPIAHVDVQVGQFFRGRDGYIKIVDYNRAEGLLYDVGRDQYCNFRNGLPGDGTYRSPEENMDLPLNEKIDVYSLGNVMYAILTGTMVHSNRESSEAVQRILDGFTEPIADEYYQDPSTAALAEAIKMCWTYFEKQRPTIFDVVQFLDNAREKRKKRGEEEDSAHYL